MDGTKREKFKFVDRTNLLILPVPEMTFPVRGMGLLDSDYGHFRAGMLTGDLGTLNNEFFFNHDTRS
ncbi:MAG: hypothetical protein M1526_05610 [Candidatus Thermoplasmatota archaeon]|jgi:catalase (peroxidase I)|nr:hypothetical protein [Candidatus Thermoplasmatota archaeon]